MHQELSREIHNEIMGLKQDVKSWQDAAFRSQEVSHIDSVNANLR